MTRAISFGLAPPSTPPHAHVSPCARQPRTSLPTHASLARPPPPPHVPHHNQWKVPSPCLAHPLPTYSHCLFAPGRLVCFLDLPTWKWKGNVCYTGYCNKCPHSKHVKRDVSLLKKLKQLFNSIPVEFLWLFSFQIWDVASPFMTQYTSRMTCHELPSNILSPTASVLSDCPPPEKKMKLNQEWWVSHIFLPPAASPSPPPSAWRLCKSCIEQTNQEKKLYRTRCVRCPRERSVTLYNL